MGRAPLGEIPHPFFPFQFANLTTSLNPLDPDKGRRGMFLPWVREVVHRGRGARETLARALGCCNPH